VLSGTRDFFLGSLKAALLPTYGELPELPLFTIRNVRPANVRQATEAGICFQLFGETSIASTTSIAEHPAPPLCKYG
jgi:hypothetical protein